MKNLNTPEERDAFTCGVDYVKDYILFCMRHYVYDLLKEDTLSLRNQRFFQRDMCMFLLRKAICIPNKQRVSFKEFCDNYETYCLKL